MTDEHAAWSEDDADGVAHRERAVPFDWSAVDSVPSSAVDDARREGAEEMLSRIVSVCAEGVEAIRGKRQRTHAVGLRLLCMAALTRPGQAVDLEIQKIEKLTGMKRANIFRIMAMMRRSMR